MTAGGQQFIFDVQNGVAGYNTDPARGADTFVPFKRISPMLRWCYDFDDYNKTYYITNSGELAYVDHSIPVNGILATGSHSADGTNSLKVVAQKDGRIFIQASMDHNIKILDVKAGQTIFNRTTLEALMVIAFYV